MKKPTEDHKEMTFLRDIGQKATVIRIDIDNELTKECNDRLYEIARNLQTMNADTKEANYIGTLCVHVYQTVILEQLYYIHQPIGIDTMPEIIASRAMQDLQHQTMRRYGRKAPTKRSGF